MASNYNTNSLPAEILINKDKFAIIRNNENIIKTIKKDSIPEWLKN